MQFQSDNAAAVHPAIWSALHAADAPDLPYDNDALSARLDEAFSALFARRCAVMWTATGTAANCLALATMAEPHRGIICHRNAHIESDECGAPAFYTHGAKLMLADGDHGRLTPDTMLAIIAPIRRDVHRVWPQAVSITQATEAGTVYRLADIAAIAQVCGEQGWALHMDGARFANAVAFLGCSAGEVVAGIDALSFGCVKNGGMSAEAVVLFEDGRGSGGLGEQAELLRYRRKRAGHLQSKGRFLAAQLLALVTDDLWLTNARAANAAAAELARAAPDRLLHLVEANELFVRCTPAERAALRAAGFGFYDWGVDAARFVTAWNSDTRAVAALATALAVL